MESLSWSGTPTERILTATLDSELEEYRLLAYLQRVDAHYREHKLYPYLDELRSRIEQLRAIGKRADELETKLVRDVIGLDLARGELLRKLPKGPTEWNKVLGALKRTVPRLLDAVERGSDLREEFSSRIRFEPIGVVPLGVREGWLLLRQNNEAIVYAYSVPLVVGMGPTSLHRRMRTRFFTTCTVSLATTYEHIKAELVRQGPLPNPATFAFESDISLPRIETFLPLAKQMVYEVVSGSAGSASGD